MTKKIIALLLALACVLSLAACGKKNDDSKTDPTPEPDPEPTTITAEYTHGYVDMTMELPQGWSWETVSDDGESKTEGIRFYKTDDTSVSYSLLCWTGGYGICGTDVTTEELTLSNGQKATQYTQQGEDGTMTVADIIFGDVPGSYVLQGAGMTAETWNANHDTLLDILATVQLARKSVSQQDAVSAAKALYTGKGDVQFSGYDVTSGAWTIRFGTDSGKTDTTVTVDAAGKAVIGTK